MVWRLGITLLAGALIAAACVPARAGDCCAPAPCTRTVCCTEWVPEQYQATRTVYTSECREEKYTAFRCECVPEVRTGTRTVCKPVYETQTVLKTVCESVPVCEERTVMKKCVSYKQVVTVSRKCVDQGHYECREVPCGPSFGDVLKKCFHKNDCCEPCCVKTKTVKVWCSNKVWVETPHTCCKRVVECVPVTVKVTVCKKVARQVPCQVNVCKYVSTPETYTYQVVTTRKIPVEATRTVHVCVPRQETVTLTRYVPHTVNKEVPITSCCETTSCKPKRCGLFSR